jgi:formyltetrahydrofolate deformylase
MTRILVAQPKQMRRGRAGGARSGAPAGRDADQVTDVASSESGSNEMTPPSAPMETSAWTGAASERGSARFEGGARLLLSCIERPGIIAAVSQFLGGRGANIAELDQHTTEPDGGLFVMRIEFRLAADDTDQRAFEEAFAAEIAEPFAMSWRLSIAARRKRVAVLVSRYDHCLAELLWRWRRGELFAEIPLVISNHAELEREAARFEVQFEHIPVRRDAKATAEAALLELLGGSYDLIVLARYMQILSSEFLNAVRTPIINIHHSFLPAFAGAEPYARAHERGVKIIGATAHYVTEELDAGPIIEQDVVRVTHRDTVEDLVRKGADLERLVLLRAVQWHLEDRVLAHGSRTVVFP